MHDVWCLQSGQLWLKWFLKSLNVLLSQASAIEYWAKSTAHFCSWLSKLHGSSFMSGVMYADHLPPSHVSKQFGSTLSKLIKAGTVHESKPILYGNSLSFTKSRKFKKSLLSLVIMSSLVPKPTGLWRRKMTALIPFGNCKVLCE